MTDDVDTLAPGDEVEYVVTLRNDGGEAVEDVLLYLTLAPELEFVETDGERPADSGRPADGVALWRVDLEPGRPRPAASPAGWNRRRAAPGGSRPPPAPASTGTPRRWPAPPTPTCAPTRRRPVPRRTPPGWAARGPRRPSSAEPPSRCWSSAPPATPCGAAAN
ncbi:hypothetical protein ACFQXA_13085 [Nocardiopsis composta]